MGQEDVFLTRQGYDRLTKEYEELKKVKRSKISKAIEKARALGDLRENAEYQAAKEAQSLNEKKIAELEHVLSRARFMDTEDIDTSKILLGAKVKLKCLDDNETEEYMFVSEAESDTGQNRISIMSPIGKGLLGHKKGDIVEVTVPAGKIKYKILDITR
ncbi:MAG: transcription elongation factor GreA [Candidatus Omnitrophica bacterium]|nr:transcription elongation factor GreA [Candidatus Omnitrophota bacterium]MBU1924340.1 transcription elongation factor GreA [Candidatus Omnitrophota bacterium]MBU2063159.1 transcription elongation factor GreA [Candidatus Omnitrophota bacterium]